MLREFTRRQLGSLAGTAALGVSAMLPSGFAEAADAQTRPASGTAPKFPKEFYWGVATSAYQIEGAVNEDGRGPSIWDTYAHTPGKIKNGDNADIASDHYHRYKDDVKLMQGIGAKAYRFSVAWPRIFPTGTGQPNSKGLDFYSRLTDELLASGIEPFATLYHWDLPQALQDKNGGWLSRDTANAFADYSGYVAEKLSDRIKHFSTINEFLWVADGGYGGILAPGLKLSPADLNQVRHHLMLAHGLSVQAIRAMEKEEPSAERPTTSV